LWKDWIETNNCGVIKVTGFFIQDKEINFRSEPVIIAEMSGNHNKSLDRALEIVEVAAKAGAHALKLQTYTADTITLDVKNDDFKITDMNSLWYGRSLYELYDEAHMPWEWHKPIFELCKELGLICFSTPFDDTAVDFLEEFDPPCYKVASFENTDLNLLRKIISTGKPVLISTGMASQEDLELIVKTVKNAECDNFVLLKCTSSYPASPKDSNILTIPDMRNRFNCQVGLSDHTMGIGAAVASVALGVTVIEKHFTLSRKDGGVDSAFSLEPSELELLVVETKRAWESLGQAGYVSGADEEKNKKFRRSLYIVEDLAAGEKKKKKNMRSVRPGFGLASKYYDDILGKKVLKNVKRGTPVSWDILCKTQGEK